MSEYNHKDIEKKWQERWEKSGIYTATENSKKKKCYVLDMFPYPSGEGLHVGHPKGYIATDIYSRFKRMDGFEVLHPMGFDAFGLPAENYAIKNKIHPRIAVEKNIKRYKEQLAILGFDYDSKREINTTDPEYYRWTQWIFIQLFKKGLAYESNEPINWCPSCKTGLANEDLENGKCERCGSIVEKKPIRQWVLRITDYAERLLQDLETLKEWPQHIKESQKNWIGRSEGVNFKGTIKDLNISVEMYNSVPQSYHAETFTVIAPEHPLVYALVKDTPQEASVMAFVENLKKKRADSKFDLEKNPEGIFTGRYVHNFADTGRDLPIWIASYVVADYGTGIVNASAHDERDFVFAKKHNIPLHPVMFPQDTKKAEQVKNLDFCYAKDTEAILTEPAKFNGRKWGEARKDIIDHIVNEGLGERKVNYKLRDWVFSRQRYWGEPIPLIHCEKCGVVPVPEKDLPVVLPEVKSYEPTGTGESPLANILEWVHTTCPTCGGQGKRETNTMPQWAGSSWYYLRYIDPTNKISVVDKDKEKYWSPVDLYVGGAEHATRHLIYARFWHKFLYDIGVVNYTEPFTRLRSVGLIMGEDGRKMGKRFGNVVNPDTIVETVGADTLRIYEMFMGPFDQAIAWDTDSIAGSRRFVERVWKLQNKLTTNNSQPTTGKREEEKEIETLLHKTIKKVGEDIEAMKFNTAISAMMIFVSELEKAESIATKTYATLLQLLAPFAPHFTEELWEVLGQKNSIHTESWPTYDPKKLVSDTVTIAVQINGKMRATFVVDRSISEDETKKMALALPESIKWLDGKEPKKVIYIIGKIVSIVT